MNRFVIIPSDHDIWNKTDLLKFLEKHQNSDIVIHMNQEGCCLTSIGLYKLLDLFDFKSVNIITANVLESHDTYGITHRDCFKFFQVSDHTDYSRHHHWTRHRIFGALYNRAIWHRMGLASHLVAYHQDMSLINFRSDPANADQRQLFEIQKLFEYNPSSVENFMANIDKFPMLLESQDGYTVGATTQEHTDQLAGFYPEFLVDVVAETFVSGRTFFPTEKTIRAMLMKKPFIIMGPKCFLIHLRQMGFRTFHDFWNEDYDGFGLGNRYDKILNLIDVLASKSATELHDMYENMQEILDHNYDLIVSQEFNKNIKYVE